MSADRRVALITGASGGLGRVLASELAAEGYDLGLVGSSPDSLASVVGDLGLSPERVETAAADLRDEAAARAAVETIRARFGRIDVLAHLVGGWTGGTHVVDTDDEPFDSMLGQHLWSTLYVSRAVVPTMVEAGHGRIVAVSTPQAVRPSAGMAAYAVGKSAMEVLFRTLAQEVVGSGVTVNVVRVRTIDTDHERDREPSDKNRSWTTPEEISAALRFLLSDAAHVVNGEAIDLHSGI